MADANDFDFEFVMPEDDGQPLPQDVENEFYLFGKVMTLEEEELLRKIRRTSPCRPLRTDYQHGAPSSTGCPCGVWR